MTQQHDLFGLQLDEASAKRIGLPQPREVRTRRLNLATIHPVDALKHCAEVMGAEIDPAAEAAARVYCDAFVEVSASDTRCST